MRVELDAFSGRPNPVWEATAPESAELLSLLRRLRTSADPVEPPGLGYRGFLLAGLGAPVRGLPPSLRVGAGVVQAADAPGSAFRDDQGLEALLVAQATAHGFGELVRVLRLPGSQAGEPD
ncbi:hypothetical protein [Streptoalloteichus hindustanus]|uniref:Uncharacterized protein n=1 Tax=Streptoalloteichus hindustanus TaxID=2017 RepID=A0A1M4VGF8_STRHI|nr:hypothetical protein [Streptoalloteichus hindustanus]SHE67960.1 hypothetical protein SAMN05444320_101760 [Streptoalloteichus hindustanus]